MNGSNLPPLDYESSRDRIERDRRPIVTGTLFSVAAGFVIMGASILFAYYIHELFDERSRIASKAFFHSKMASVTAIGAAATLYMLVRSIRTPRWQSIREWGFPAILLGGGVALIIGELYFFASFK